MMTPPTTKSKFYTIKLSDDSLIHDVSPENVYDENTIEKVETTTEPSIAEETEETEESEKYKGGGCCGFFHNHQVIAILAFAIVGIGAGIGLSFWEPEDLESKKVAIKWLGLIGDLFLRSLKCFVLPLVCCN